MSDNLTVKDGNALAQTIRSTDDSGVHVPHHVLSTVDVLWRSSPRVDEFSLALNNAYCGSKADAGVELDCTAESLPGVTLASSAATSVTFSALTRVQGNVIGSNAFIETLQFDGLTLEVTGSFVVSSARLSLMVTPDVFVVGTSYTVTGTLLESITLPETVGTGISVTSNTELEQVVLASLTTIVAGQTWTFADNGLSAAQVDAILAKWVELTDALSITTGTLTLTGNTAPGAQGATDKATLQGLGLTVNTD